jgi:hypothetical protein
MTTKPANPKRKSTAACSKSTVDLGLEPLIWDKNGLQTPFLPNNDTGMEACKPKAGRSRPKNGITPSLFSK